MHTQCHKSVRKVIKEIPFLFWVLTEDFLLPWLLLKEKGAFVMPKKRKRGQKSTTQNLLQLHKRPEEWFVQKKGKCVTFFKNHFSGQKKSVWTFEFHFLQLSARPLKWKTAKKKITFLDFLVVEFTKIIYILLCI